MNPTLQIRLLREGDARVISEACQAVGWRKPQSQYERYLAEQAAGRRTCFIAEHEDQFAGYVTVNWKPTYPAFVEMKIPEIQDLNVLPEFRNRGIASALLDHGEKVVAKESSTVGIGVGLHPGYNAAQRLYAKRGYIPDGRGISYRDRYPREGESVVLDDHLLLHLMKHLA